MVKFEAFWSLFGHCPGSVICYLKKYIKIITFALLEKFLRCYIHILLKIFKYSQEKAL